MDVQVFGISTDSQFTLKHWSDEHLKLTYPLLSDHMRKVSESYGVLMPEAGMASRATFVIDVDGKIQEIEQGSSAIDPTGAMTACKRIRGK
jgi:peroxiredoxin (alkyl hydroperoxide reductase subunit C)